MKKTIALLMTLSMTLGLCACHSFTGDETETPVPRFDMTVKYSYDDQQLETEDGTVYYRQELGTVQVSSKDERAAQKINETLGELYVSFAETAGYTKKVAADQSGDNGESIMTLSYECDPKAMRCDTRVLSLVFDVEQYIGGVHGGLQRVSRSFNADSGELLTLADIAKNEDQLKTFLKNYVIGLAAGEEYYEDDGVCYLFDDAQEVIGSIVDEGEQWYFNDNGIVVYTNPYDIAPYAYGILRFEVPYSALEEFMDADYMPIDYEGENGMVLADAGSDTVRAELNMLDTVTVDENMQSVILSAEETVYDVRIYSAERMLWQRNYLTTGEGVEVISSIPDVLPNIAISYRLSDGTQVTRGIFHSGKDGSIILTELTEDEPLYTADWQ